MKLKKLKFDSIDELNKKLESFNLLVYYKKNDLEFVKEIDKLISEIKKLESKNVEKDEEELFFSYFSLNKLYIELRKREIWKKDENYCKLMLSIDLNEIPILLKKYQNNLIERYKYEKLNKINNPEFISSRSLFKLFDFAKPNEKFLLIDLRKKEDFSKCRIDFKEKRWDKIVKILYIPENKIFTGLTVLQINKFLDENQLLLFNSRNLVKNVILMDKESTSSNYNEKLFSFYQALIKYDNTEYRVNKNLLILNGGFEDWYLHYPYYCTFFDTEIDSTEYLLNELENFSIQNNFENESKAVPGFARYFGSEIKSSTFSDNNFKLKPIQNETIYPDINNFKNINDEIDFDFEEKKKRYEVFEDNQININKPKSIFNQNYNKTNYSDSISLNSDLDEEDDLRNSSNKPIFDRSTKPSFLINRTINKNSISANKMRDFTPIYGFINQPTGLENLGNTCFMNAVIQCLYHTEKFSNYFINKFYLKDLQKKSNYESNGDLSKEFGNLMSNMNKSEQVCPSSFRQMIAKHVPVYKSSEQQDSHEFLLILFEKLHADLNIADSSKNSSFKLPENISSEQAINKFWLNHIECNNSIVSTLFEGLIMSTLECNTCKKNSNTFEVFSCLSLPIPNMNAEYSCQLKDCLDEFTKNEIMCNEAAWDCPECKIKRTATKKTSIIKLPKVLIIHLKRFSFEGNWEKIKKFVDFPMNELNLRHFISYKHNQNSTSNYNLIGVVDHTGTMGGGHYTAICRSETNNSIKWNKLNDQEVKEVSPMEVVSEKAYLLFYELKE